jgi:hypothetical protein
LTAENRFEYELTARIVFGAGNWVRNFVRELFFSLVVEGATLLDSFSDFLSRSLISTSSLLPQTDYFLSCLFVPGSWFLAVYRDY